MGIQAEVKWTPLGHMICQGRPLLCNQQRWPCPPGSEFCPLAKGAGPHLQGNLRPRCAFKNRQGYQRVLSEGASD